MAEENITTKENQPSKATTEESAASKENQFPKFTSKEKNAGMAAGSVYSFLYSVIN